MACKKRRAQHKSQEEGDDDAELPPLLWKWLLHKRNLVPRLVWNQVCNLVPSIFLLSLKSFCVGWGQISKIFTCVQYPHQTPDREAMARRSLFLVAAAVLLAAVAGAGDAPFVVAHKRVKLSRPGPGVERLAVTLDLYNQGSATAYDVSLNDDSWPQEAFELVSGSTSKIVEKLEPGSTASHNFVLETKVRLSNTVFPQRLHFRRPIRRPSFHLISSLRDLHSRSSNWIRELSGNMGRWHLSFALLACSSTWSRAHRNLVLQKEARRDAEAVYLPPFFVVAGFHNKKQTGATFEALVVPSVP